ncbi:LytR/AlgR family response regulator transcription factor [Psychroserpens sp.]
MKKVAIIDDNKAARDAIRSSIEHNFKNKFEIKEANNVSSGHNLILEFQPDIVLLDMEMGDGTGLDLIQLFPEINFKLVFITAHKDYAIKAIKHRPHAYLLKPFNPFDLIKIINQLISENKSIEQSNKTIDKIAVKNQDTTILIDIKDIIRCEADGSYTKITTHENHYMASKNLKHFENLLKSSNFLRVHNTHLINTNFIQEFNRHVQSGITMKNGDKIPVSTRKTKEISTFLDTLS